MTETPNTAAIRAEWGEGWPGVEVLIPLCDALDDARAKREEALASVERWMIAEYESSQRAEVAEAEVAQWRVWADDALADARARAEAATARIAAALVICDERGAYGRVDIEDVRRALTEGTGR